MLRWSARNQLVFGLLGYVGGALFYAASMGSLYFVAETPLGEQAGLAEMRAGLAEGKQMVLDDDAAATTLKTAGDTEAGLSTKGNEPWQPVSLADIEREHILATLRSTNWNKSQTAGILGIERSTLDRKIRRYDLTDLKPS